MSERPLVNVDLFGVLVDEFRSAKERYGVWPLTVWPCDHQDAQMRRLRALVSDNGEQRAECFTAVADDESVYRGKVTVSVFNPVTALRLLNAYAPPTGICFDPFAGGGTRAIMSAKHGLRYVGCEIRAEECRAIRERVQRLDLESSVEIVEVDARFAATFIGQGVADFLLTCPPYWNLEKYNGGPADLSNSPTWERFREDLSAVIGQTAVILKTGAISCWVVGLLRDSGGELLPLHHAVATAHAKHGFRLKEEIILHQIGNGAIQRVGNFDKGHHHLVRVHEYALVFEKSCRPGSP